MNDHNQDQSEPPEYIAFEAAYNDWQGQQHKTGGAENPDRNAYVAYILPLLKQGTIKAMGKIDGEDRARPLEIFEWPQIALYEKFPCDAYKLQQGRAKQSINYLSTDSLLFKKYPFFDTKESNENLSSRDVLLQKGAEYIKQFNEREGRDPKKYEIDKHLNDTCNLSQSYIAKLYKLKDYMCEYHKMEKRILSENGQKNHPE